MDIMLSQAAGSSAAAGHLLWIVSAAVFALWTVRRGMEQYGLCRETVSCAVSAAYISAVAGALFFGALESGQSLFSPSAWRGDLSSAGGILCGAAAAMAALAGNKPALRAFPDAAAVPAALATGIWRLGCFAAGCCRGAETQEGYFLSVHYAGESAARLAYPLAESSFAFACVLTLLYIEKRASRTGGQGNGAVAGSALFLYGAFRMLTDFLREDGLGACGFAAFAFLTIAGAAAVITGRGK